jgi:hypothetical protein
VRSFTIVTTTPNELCAELHNRIPVVLKRKAWPVWLAEQLATVSQLKALLAPYPSEDMICWPVSARVGNVKNNDPSLSDPVAAAKALSRSGRRSSTWTIIDRCYLIPEAIESPQPSIVGSESPGVPPPGFSILRKAAVSGMSRLANAPPARPSAGPDQAGAPPNLSTQYASRRDRFVPYRGEHPAHRP